MMCKHYVLNRDVRFPYNPEPDERILRVENDNEFALKGDKVGLVMETNNSFIVESCKTSQRFLVSKDPYPFKDKVVFTIITGGYDDLKPIGTKNHNWRYIAIVDDIEIDPKGWELLHISALTPPEGLSNVYRQRWAKVVGAIEYFQCDTIYVDGKLSIEKDVTELFPESSGFSVMEHKVRKCVYDEAHACARLNKAAHNLIERQINHYQALGMPKYLGMFDTSLICREYSGRNVQFGRLWWKELLSFTHRDQLSVTKVQWEEKIDIMPIPNKMAYNYVTLHKHKQ